MSKYILWVGGIDDHYNTYEGAYEDLLKWRSKGFSAYDDLIIEEVDDNDPLLQRNAFLDEEVTDE